MENQLPERVPSVYLDEEHNLIFVTKSKNPAYVEPFGNDPKSAETSLPMFLPAQKFTILRPPYTVRQVADAIQSAVNEWDKYPPVKYDGRDAIEIYCGTRNFKTASLGKRLFELEWSEEAPKCVSLMLPCKTPRMWMGITAVKLPPTADWYDYAEVVLSFADADVTKYPAFKSFKRYLNLTPSKTK